MDSPKEHLKCFQMLTAAQWSICTFEHLSIWAFVDLHIPNPDCSLSSTSSGREQGAEEPDTGYLDHYYGDQDDDYYGGQDNAYYGDQDDEDNYYYGGQNGENNYYYGGQDNEDNYILSWWSG